MEWRDLIKNNWVTVMVRPIHSEQFGIVCASGWQSWSDGTRVIGPSPIRKTYASFTEACAAIEKEQKERSR